MKEYDDDYPWRAYANTNRGVMYVPRRDQWECLEYHIFHQHDPLTWTGKTVIGGWTEGPNGERLHDWGDTEFRAKPVFHVFMSSQNKARWVFCHRCRKHLQNGAPYRPVGSSFKLCLECAEETGE